MDFDWTDYKGPAVRDPGTRAWLIWRRNAAKPGYYPAADPATHPATARRDRVLIEAARAEELAQGVTA